jgi:hypothetical protein
MGNLTDRRGVDHSHGHVREEHAPYPALETLLQPSQLIFTETAKPVGFEMHDVDDTGEMNVPVVEAAMTSAIRGPAVA